MALGSQLQIWHTVLPLHPSVKGKNILNLFCLELFFPHLFIFSISSRPICSQLNRYRRKIQLSARAWWLSRFLCRLLGCYLINGVEMPIGKVMKISWVITIECSDFIMHSLCPSLAKTWGIFHALNQQLLTVGSPWSELDGSVVTWVSPGQGRHRAQPCPLQGISTQGALAESPARPQGAGEGLSTLGWAQVGV